MKLMAPQIVQPYVKINKNDAVDAEAICEAVARPTMRFMPVNSAEQQGVLHRTRQGFVKARTAQAKQIHGRLVEYRILLRQAISHIARQLTGILEESENGLPGLFHALLDRPDYGWL